MPLQAILIELSLDRTYYSYNITNLLDNQKQKTKQAINAFEYSKYIVHEEIEESKCEKVEKEYRQLILDFVDLLLPDLTPYEASLYLYLLRNSILNGTSTIRIGKRTIATGYGTGSRGVKTNYAHVTKIIKGLEEKGCIKIGDANRKGTLYTVVTPRDIPLVAEKIASFTPENYDENYFTEPEKRRLIFERDKWICKYCGEKVQPENATLDHYIPKSKGGEDNKENLCTCCLVCNSVKSGKTFEEAAPFILKSIQERKRRSNL